MSVKCRAYAKRGNGKMNITEKDFDNSDKAKDVEQSIRKRFKKTIWSRFTRAINTYDLVKPGDKIAVCISGGKDSMLMAKCFQELKLHNKFEFAGMIGLKVVLKSFKSE